ncbi:MAG: mevalonate kinase [Chloroflexota bacterium]
MPAFTATAPGKIILFGEHSVVYGQPAIAVPVTQVQVKATIHADVLGMTGSVHILAPEVNLDSHWDALDPMHPIASAIENVVRVLEVTHIPACTLKLKSSIPIAGGLGSGAAVSVAVIRALSTFLGTPLDKEQINKIAYKIEKIHHGTPSGIDNTVITYAKPVYFVQQQPIETLNIGKSFTIIIADTGIASPTSLTVGDVKKSWDANPVHYERLFSAVGSITRTARGAIESGTPERLGPLMNENHELLNEMGVSSPELEYLVNAARKAGALGAKLSGGGRGGNMIALVDAEEAERISQALQKAGAVKTIITEINSRDMELSS